MGSVAFGLSFQCQFGVKRDICAAFLVLMFVVGSVILLQELCSSSFCLPSSMIIAEALQADRDVVSAAVQQNGLALHFASPRLRRDKDRVSTVP